MPPTTFYFDVGSPYAYLAAERAERVLPGRCSWQPVLLGGLFKLTGRSSWALGDYRRRQRGMAEIERRARGYGLPPIMWPDPWPSDYLGGDARRDARVPGRTRAELVAARVFADGFARGRDLSIKAHVLDAASRAGLDRAEARRRDARPGDQGDAARGDRGGARARACSAFPTVAVGEELFWGDDRLEDAAACAFPSGPRRSLGCAAMPRPTSIHVCSACGHESPRWAGRCPGCGEWNTLVEEVRKTGPAARGRGSGGSRTRRGAPP